LEHFEEDLERRLEQEEITLEEMQKLREAYGDIHLQKQTELNAALEKEEEDAAKAKIEIDRAVQQQKIDGALTAATALIGASKSIFGETKASAVAETVINTYQSATSAFKSLSGIPVVGPILGAIAAAAAIASGIANLAKIKGSNKKETAPPQPVVVPNQNPFQEGGYITGLPHSQGGTTITAESGEYVSSRRTMSSAFGPIIENLNRMGNGGMAGSAVLSEERVAQIAASMITKMPPVLVVDAVTNKQRSTEVREQSFVR
jgi:hypothetical protein